MLRAFTYKGTVLDRVDGYDDPAQASTDDHAALEVATALGVSVLDITVFHPDTKPVVQQYIPATVLDAPAPTVEDMLLARLDAVEAAVGITKPVDTPVKGV